MPGMYRSSRIAEMRRGFRICRHFRRLTQPLAAVCYLAQREHLFAAACLQNGVPVLTQLLGHDHANPRIVIAHQDQPFATLRQGGAIGTGEPESEARADRDGCMHKVVPFDRVWFSCAPDVRRHAAE